MLIARTVSKVSRLVMQRAALSYDKKINSADAALFNCAQNDAQTVGACCVCVVFPGRHAFGAPTTNRQAVDNANSRRFPGGFNAIFARVCRGKKTELQVSVVFEKTERPPARVRRNERRDTTTHDGRVQKLITRTSRLKINAQSCEFFTIASREYRANAWER